MPPKPQIYKFVSFKIIGFESNLFRRDFCWFASLVIVVNWVEPTKDFWFSILADTSWFVTQQTFWYWFYSATFNFIKCMSQSEEQPKISKQCQFFSPSRRWWCRWFLRPFCLRNKISGPWRWLKMVNTTIYESEFDLTH